jgi:hypothetical protein
MMAKVSEARVSRNKVANSPAKARTFNFARKFLERITERSNKKERMLRSEMNISRRAFGKVLMGIIAGAAATSLPSALRADERVVRAEVPRESIVQYETFSDPAELEPYFKNAEDKLVSIKQGEVKKIGEFDVSINRMSEFGTEFKLRDPNGKETTIIHATPLSEINILELDLGDHPYFQGGKLVLFADENRVTGAGKVASGYVVGLIGNPKEGKMREGPIRTGIEMDGDTLLVICSPKHLMEGDVVYQAQVDREGRTAVSYYKYTKSKPAGTMIASL